MIWGITVIQQKWTQVPPIKASIKNTNIETLGWVDKKVKMCVCLSFWVLFFDVTRKQIELRRWWWENDG